MARRWSSFFRDRKGRLVLAQVPNAPLWVWAAAALLERVTEGRIAAVASLVSFGAIFTWAWLELTDGATPFRRVLGGVVLAYSVWTRV